VTLPVAAAVLERPGVKVEEVIGGRVLLPLDSRPISPFAEVPKFDLRRSLRVKNLLISSLRVAGDAPFAPDTWCAFTATKPTGVELVVLLTPFVPLPFIMATSEGDDAV
jgi:hypothetical protein